MLFRSLILDPFQFKLQAKTIGTNLINQSKKIEIENIKTQLSLKSFIEDKFSIENLEISSKSEIGWGHQIRSYVLQPYRLVKDNRSNFESSNPDKILDGEIDEFLEQSLYQT